MPQDFFRRETELLAGEPQVATRTILLVEDDLDLGSFLAEALAQGTSCRVIVATTSHAALHLVQHVTPDLLLLDYGLPDMNGIALYDHLHTKAAFAAVPAILITASRSVPQEQLTQRQLITFEKPFDLVALLEAIQALLNSP